MHSVSAQQGSPEIDPAESVTLPSGVFRETSYLRKTMSGNIITDDQPSLNQAMRTSSKNMNALLAADSETGSAVDGLVERQDSAIKAVSSPPPREEVNPVRPPNADVARMIVIPAGNIGRSSARNSPRKNSGHSRTPSGSVVIDVTARTPSRTAATPTRELDRMYVENRAPARFMCPVSGRIMRDPVILTTGTTCDRGAMERRLAKGHKRDPVTKRPLKKPIHMMPNVELRNAITTWAKKNAPWLLDRDGHLDAKDPHPFELQGDDPQYVCPEPTDDAPGAAGPNRSVSRIESGKSQWQYTNGGKVRPGAANYDINATAGAGVENGASPWRGHRGIASAPRSMRGSRRSSRSRSPSKKGPVKRDWYSTGFLGAISIIYVSLFIVSLSENGWKMASMDVNPWYGASPEALAATGAQVLPLMEGPSNEWWRLLSAIFLPAGLIHMALCLAGLWLYGRYVQLALPWPQFSVAGVYLVSALLGSLGSVNLNADYVSCGAAAGVCGLLGSVCADQLLNWRKKKLFNLREWWLAALVLIVNAGVFITFSLLPMTTVWYAALGLLTGLLGSIILLVLPNVEKEKPKRAAWISLQSVCGVLILGGLVAAAVGCAMPTKLGESVGLLKDASCVDLNDKWWVCTPYGSSPSGCAVVVDAEGAALLSCPGGAAPIAVPELDASMAANSTAIEGMCQTYCATAAAAAPAPAEAAIPVTIIEPVNASVEAMPPAAAVPTTVIEVPTALVAAPTIAIEMPTTVIDVPTTVVQPITLPVASGPAVAPPADVSIMSTSGRKLRAGRRRL